MSAPGQNLFHLLRANPSDLILLVTHLPEHCPDLVHQLLSTARENHLVCSCKPVLPADVNRHLEFGQFLFYERLEGLDAFQLSWISGCENLQLAHHQIEAFERLAIRLKVRLISR